MTIRRAVTQLALVLAWTIGVSTLFLLVVYPALTGGWARSAGQVAADVVLVIPVLLVRPAVALPLGWSRWTAVVAVALIAAATAFALLAEHETLERGLQHAIAAVSAGLGEEVVFRGLIWARLASLVPGTAARSVVDAALFAAFHVPVAAVQGESGGALLAAFGFGLLLAVLRALTGGLGLPAAVHVAIDLSS